MAPLPPVGHAERRGPAAEPREHGVKLLALLITPASAGCLALAGYRSVLAQRSRGDRLVMLGWQAALLALAVSLFGFAGGDHDWPLLFLVAACVLVILAPGAARWLVPWALLLIGLYGFVFAERYARGDRTSVLYGGVLAGAGSWRTSLLMVQVYGFLVLGGWLLWRTVAPRSFAARLMFGPSPAGSFDGGERWHWGLLLVPLAVAASQLLRFPPGGLDESVWNVPWTAMWALAALAVAGRARPLAADLAALSTIALGLYCVEQSVAGTSGVYGLVLVYSPTTTVPAMVQGLLLTAAGVWLVPRTVGTHIRALLARPADVALASRVRQLTETRAVAADSAATELRRIERDLHDGAQARLVALGMSLRAVERLIESSPQAALALVAEAREASARALTDLRELVRGIYPPVLADRGLAEAVRALALDSPVRTTVNAELTGRLDAPVESACYFGIAEALTNAVKHAEASAIQIDIRYVRGQQEAGMLRIEAVDDGIGGADPARGTGLAGVEKRLATFDGVLAVSSPIGGPTIVVMEVPCVLSSQKTSSC
jgi:signal transduction histidine kinase